MTDRFSLWECPKCGKTLKSAGGHPASCGKGPERFWAKVDKGPHPKGCWLYTGFKKWDGYGWLARWMDGRIRYMTAHRYAWILTHGKPAAGLSIRHKCDNPPCCNPDHLELGTHAENMRDCHARERHAYGERNHKAKLTYAQVTEMRRLRAEGLTLRELAKRFPVAETVVQQICAGKKWKVPHAATPSPVRRDPRPRRQA